MSTPVKKPKIIVILGPTASGKSELAVKIAKYLSTPSQIKSNKSLIFEKNSNSSDENSRNFSAEIISADSRQVYKGLDIGSGKVPRDKPKIKNQKSKLQLKNQSYFYKGIKHHLLDVVSPKKTFTVAQYQKLAKKTLQKIFKKKGIPIICGGAGFYIDTLIYDYQLPAVPPQPKLRKQLEKKSAEELFKKLQKLDPRRAKNIDKYNRRRLIRALEIILITNKPVPSLNNISVNQNKNQNKPTTTFAVLKIGVKKSTEELKKLINKRLLKRLRQGMISEVKKLHQSGVSWQKLDDLGLEYRYVARYLQKLITKKEMIELLCEEIYRYAKRQMTWFKKDKKIIWIKNFKEAEILIKVFFEKK